MEKKRKSKIQKWDENTGVTDVEIDDTAASFDEAGAGPVLSRNPMKSIEDLIEQNDNNLDGVINNLPEPKPVSQMTSEDVIELEQKKKSVLKKLQEAAPKEEAPRTVRGCLACCELERF